LGHVLTRTTAFDHGDEGTYLALDALEAVDHIAFVFFPKSGGLAG
jgi:hypothetical protein